jgi:hypothetical protein
MLGDPKMTRLSIAERGCWDGILLLAGQSPIRGKLMLTETKSMSLDDISKALSLTYKEKKVLTGCISKMIELNSLRWNENNCLEVIHFKERQEVYPSDFEDYHKKSPDKLLKNSDITPEKLQKEGEGRGEKKDITPLSKDKGARTKQVDPIVNEIFTEMRTHLGFPDRVQKDPIPSYGKEGQAIKRMLTRGFTRGEILACWRGKISQCGGEFVSMTWVNEDIGKKGVKAGEQSAKQPKQKRVRPITYIPGSGKLGPEGKENMS